MPRWETHPSPVRDPHEAGFERAREELAANCSKSPRASLAALVLESLEPDNRLQRHAAARGRTAVLPGGAAHRYWLLGSDSIVFDWVRELWGSQRELGFPRVVNSAILQTITRTVGTGLGAVFILSAPDFLGGH